MVHVTTGTLRMRFADGSALLQHYFMRLAFVPGWQAVVPEDAVASTFAALEAALNAAGAERGGPSLTVPMACVHAVRGP